MKRFIKNLFILLILLSAGYVSQAQDKIVLKSGEIIHGKITEISDLAVKYVEIEDASQIVFSVNRGQVREIKLEQGKVIDEQAFVMNESYFTDDNRSNLKLNFLAIGGDALLLSYERAVDYKSSWEVTAKILGLGFENSFGHRDLFGIGNTAIAF